MRLRNISIFSIVILLISAIFVYAAATGNLTVGTGGLTVAGGNFYVKTSGGTTKYSIAPATGNTAIAGTLSVTGTTALTGAATLTGLINANGGIAVDTSNFTVSGTNGAVVMKPTTTTTVGVLINGSTQTSGDALQIKTIAGTLNGGYFLNCLDNTTSVLSVAETGILTTASNIVLGGDLLGPTSAEDAAGQALDITAPAGGTATAGGKAGGALTVTAGAGSAGVGAVTSGAGGATSLIAGAGAAASGATGTGGDGGAINISSGAAGAANGGAAGTAGVINFKIGGTTKVVIDASGDLKINTNKFTVANSSGNTAIAGTLSYVENIDTSSISDGAHTVGAADNQKVFIATKADGASTLTLPTPAAGNSGWRVKIIQTVDQNLIITGDADKMIVLGGDGTNQAATFSTASEKLGAAAECVSNGTMWIVVGLGKATITPS